MENLVSMFLQVNIIFDDNFYFSVAMESCDSRICRIVEPESCYSHHLVAGSLIILPITEKRKKIGKK